LPLVASSCTRLDIKDIPINWDVGPDGAIVTHLVSEESSDVPKEEWDKKRFGYACISQDDFGWLKATIEKACSELKGMCRTEDKKVMKAFFDRAERLKQRKKFR
jgi:hypothetical protein